MHADRSTQEASKWATWRAHVVAMLDQWSRHQTSHPFENALFWRKILQNGCTPTRSPANYLLEAVTTTLAATEPQAAALLRMRFRDDEKINTIATKWTLAESTVYKLQRHAIDQLTTTLLQLEGEAQSAHTAVIERRLEPPSYLALIGVDALLTQLLDVLLTPGPPWLILLAGIGGIGKTTVADALVRRFLFRSEFADIGWVSARPTVFNLGGALQAVTMPALTTTTLVECMADQLLVDFPKPTPFVSEKVLTVLQTRFRQQAHLIVIDNLETVVDVESLLPTLRRLTNPTKFLLTSRQNLYAAPDVYHYAVPELPAADALRLVRQEAQNCNLPALATASATELTPIFATVGGNPLALRLVVGQTHAHALDVVLDDLRAARGASTENLYAFIYRRAWDNLDELTRRLFLAMPLAPERGGTLAYLSSISGLAPGDLHTALQRLVALNLVDSRGDLHERRYTIHPLTRTFLQQQVAQWP